MATEKITIVVEERGTRVVKRSIEDIGKSAEQAAGGVEMLKGLLAGLGVVAGLGAFIKLLDTFTNMQNKIRNVTTDVAELRVIMADLTTVANGSRQSLEGTVELYTQMSLAAKDLGTSQRELINFTESIQRIVAMSGAAGESAKAALTQLAQGLGSGTLRGEELNSLLEQLPMAADVIARGMGVTRGELRKLGEEGKITAEKVLGAFRQAREEIAERFARSIPTVSQSLQVVRNNVLSMAGAFDSATGLSTALANGLLSVADNLGTIVRVAGAAAIVIGTVLARQAIGALVAGISALTAAIAANPIGALVVGITAGIALLVTFSDQIKLTQGSITTLADFAVAAWESIKAGLTTLADYISSVFAPAIAVAKSVFGDVEISVLGILRAVAKVMDDIIGLFVGTFNAIKAAWANLPSAIKEIFVNMMNGVVSTVEAGINRMIMAINSVGSVVGLQLIAPLNLPRIENAAAGAGSNLGREVAEGFRQGFESRPTTALLEGVVNRADQLAQARQQANRQRELEDAAARARLGQSGPNNTRPPADSGGRGRQRRQVTFEELYQSLVDENTILKANREEREALREILQMEDQLRRSLTETERAQVEQIVKESEALYRLNRAHEDVTGPQRRTNERMQDLNTLLEQGKISITEYEREMRKLRVTASEFDNTLSGGIQNGLARLAEKMNDFGTGIGENIVGAFNDATDAIVDFAKTGEFNVKKMISSISERLLRFATDQLWAQLANSLLGGGNQGGAGGLGRLLGGGGGGAGGGGLLTTVLGGLLGSGSGTGEGLGMKSAGSMISSLFGGGMKDGGGGLSSLFSSFTSLLGFREGGSFTVGGSGGPDTKLVAFRATPGEQVDVRTPGQQAAQQPQAAGKTEVKVVNVTDPAESVSGMRTAEGQQIILNVIERNAPALRQALGIA